MKKIVIDLDHTISFKEAGDTYENARPNYKVIKKITEYKRLGYEICIFTARNMRTYDNNIGLINANTLPIILSWLKRHDIQYDEIIVGKPWCGEEGFYVDDRAIRPDEFIQLSEQQIKRLVGLN